MALLCEEVAGGGVVSFFRDLYPIHPSTPITSQGMGGGGGGFIGTLPALVPTISTHFPLSWLCYAILFHRPNLLTFLSIGKNNKTDNISYIMLSVFLLF